MLDTGAAKEGTRHLNVQFVQLEEENDIFPLPRLTDASSKNLGQHHLPQF